MLDGECDLRVRFHIALQSCFAHQYTLSLSSMHATPSAFQVVLTANPRQMKELGELSCYKG